MAESARFWVCDLEYVYGNLGIAGRRLAELRNQLLSGSRLSLLHSVYKTSAQIELVKENYSGAAKYASEGLIWAKKTGAKFAIGELCNVLAEIYAHINSTRARTFLIEAVELLTTCDAQLELGKSKYILAEIELLEGNAEAAQSEAISAKAHLTRINYGSGIARSLLAFAEACYAMGEVNECFDAARTASSYYSSERIYPSWRAKALRICVACKGHFGNEAVELPDRFEDIPHQQFFPPFDVPYVGAMLGLPKSPNVPAPP
jgi:hypothetical protein